MPKKKTQIDETEITTRYAFYQAASLSVLDVDKRYVLGNPDAFNVSETYKFDNAQAAFNWSHDVVISAKKIAVKETPKGWNIASNEERLIKVLPLGIMNVTSISYYYEKQINKTNLWRKAPYCFVGEGNKIFTYFVGNKTIMRADKYAHEYQTIFRRSGAHQEIARKAYIFARHAAVCYYTLTGQEYSKVWGTFPMQSAFAGENVGDEVLQNVCRLIKKNYDGVALPDCWQMLHK